MNALLIIVVTIEDVYDVSYLGRHEADLQS